MNSQSNSAHHDQSIRRFIRRLALLLAFKQSLTFVTIWLFIWGAVALVLRAARVARAPRRRDIRADRSSLEAARRAPPTRGRLASVQT